MSVKSRLLAVGIGVAAVVLSGCVPVHPGTAAVVNGERITMQDADEAAHTFCVVNTLGQDPSTTLDNAEIRRQALMTLIATEVADQIAEEKNLHVAVEEPNDEQLEMVRGELNDEDRAAFDRLLARNLRLGAIALELGRATDSQLTATDALTQLGYEQILAAMAKGDIDIDPRFAMSSQGEALADSGSLSVATVNLEAPAQGERSPLLHCTP